MKLSSSLTVPKNSAFTLIELLVVISIIAILAGLSMAGIKAATESARKLSAKNDMQQIIVAIKAYYTDYGKYPVLTDGATGAMDLTYGGPNSKKLNGEIINVLRYGTDSNWSDSNRLNPREIH